MRDTEESLQLYQRFSPMFKTSLYGVKYSNELTKCSVRHINFRYGGIYRTNYSWLSPLLGGLKKMRKVLLYLLLWGAYLLMSSFVGNTRVVFSFSFLIAEW